MTDLTKVQLVTMEDDDKLGINADRTILLYYGHIAWVGEAAVLMTYKYL